MPVNDTPGPSYPVGPKGQPAGCGLWAQMPSPSNPKIFKLADVSVSEGIVREELLRTPIKVSSEPSKVADWAASVRIDTVAVLLMLISSRQPVFRPVGGHSAKETAPAGGALTSHPASRKKNPRKTATRFR